MIQALIPALAPIITKVVGSIFPDKEAQKKAELEITVALMQNQHELNKVAGEIIQSEASSSSWLASSWRPLVMLTFAGLIVARWFGWATPNLSEAEYLKLWTIVEFGLGGYVVGRSVEKVVPQIAEVMRKK